MKMSCMSSGRNNKRWSSLAIVSAMGNGKFMMNQGKSHSTLRVAHQGNRIKFILWIDKLLSSSNRGVFYESHVINRSFHRAFKELKKAIMEELMLVLPNHTKPFEAHTIISKFAIGRLLMQEGHPIAFDNKINIEKRCKRCGRMSLLPHVIFKFERSSTLSKN